MGPAGAQGSTAQSGERSTRVGRTVASRTMLPDLFGLSIKTYGMSFTPSQVAPRPIRR